MCYWHEPRPKWNETVKIQIPLDRFRDAHLRFVFKHRSATDVKDKAEKPYALAYLRLMKVRSMTLSHVYEEITSDGTLHCTCRLQEEFVW